MAERATELTPPKLAVVPSNWREYLRGMGPGIVIAMVWLGAGDLVDAAVSGANYGYTLMWALIIALLSRFFVTSTLAKYQLCNSQGDSIMDGFGRMWKGYPMIIAVVSVLLGTAYNSFLLRGAGTALFNLFGRVGGETWGVFLWSALISAFSIYLAYKPNQYKWMEWVANAAVGVLALTFIGGVLVTGVDLVAFVKGLSFSFPSDVGPYGAVLVTLALIGIIGGSVANLLYVYFMKEKGWVGPAYRKLQIYDLLAGIVSVIIIDIAVWIVSVEVLNSAGLLVSSENDLAQMMTMLLGPAGGILLWVGIFGATFDNIPANSFGYASMMTEAVHRSNPSRAARYDNTLKSDPMFKRIEISMMIFPLIFALPAAPNLITLILVISAGSVVAVPIIIVGLIWLVNNKKLMLPQYLNTWWENAILLTLGGIGVWGLWGTLTGLVKTIGDLIKG